jgi:ABC-type transport system involved in cytochrome c biogenesis permease subunit
MEALKFLAAAVVFAVIFASVITFLVSLAIDPLERMRLRWLEREREAEAAKAVRV